MSIIVRQPDAAARDAYDVIVVGGGIYGAMLLLEAGLRGWKALLVERGDFGGETSFNSLRIVHGGLRYLQALDLPRFFESVRERRWFFQNFPDLVTPLPCLMPIYGEGLRRRGVLATALGVNDLLRCTATTASSPINGSRESMALRRGDPRALSKRRCRRPARGGPVVRRGHARFAAASHRGVALGLRARRPGPELCRGETGLGLDGRRVTGITAIDRESGQGHRYSAGIVVNATGPWSRALAGHLDRDAEELFIPTIAWNVWFAREALSTDALALTPRRPGARTYFLHPWKGRLLAGTGHAPWWGGPDQPRPSDAQLSEFIADLNDAVPGLRLRDSEVVHVFAGLLPARDERREALSVRAVLLDHGVRGGAEGLYSVSGVKFTASRLVADKTLKRIARRSPEGRKRSPVRDPSRPARRPG